MPRTSSPRTSNLTSAYKPQSTPKEVRPTPIGQRKFTTGKSNTWFRKFGKWFVKHPWNELGKLWKKITGEKQREDAVADRAHDETYNSPAAILSRNKLAGVATTGMSPVPTDSSGMAEEDASGAVSMLGNIGSFITNGVGNVVDLLKLRKQRAEIDNLNARTANTSADTGVKQLNSDYLKSIAQDRVKQAHFATLMQEQGLNKLMVEIEEARANVNLKGKDAKLRDISIALAESTFDSNVQLAALEVENKELSNKIKEYDLNKVMPKQLEELNTLIAHYKNSDTIARYNAETNRQLSLNDYQRTMNDYDRVVMMQGYYDEQTRSLKFDNDATQKTFDSYVQSLEDTYHLTQVEANWAATHQWLKVVNTAAVTVGQSAAAYSSIRRGRSGGTARTGRMTSFDNNDWEVGSAILM